MKIIILLLFMLLSLAGCTEHPLSLVDVPVNTENITKTVSIISVNSNHVITLGGSINLSNGINQWIEKNPDKVIISISYVKTGRDWYTATIVYKEK